MADANVTTEAQRRRARGRVFADPDVVRCYRYRPPYSPELFEFLLERSPRRARALDLGCGPGKIARVLALYFEEIQAIDPSPEMLHLARGDVGGPTNVDWIQASGEDARFARDLDLATAGASIHWMDPALVFPKLHRCLTDTARMAIIDGDAPHEPPWEAAWRPFVERWLMRVGESPGSPQYVMNARAHEPWIDVELDTYVSAPFTQPVRDFIECQHSRATWARAAMGEAAAREFDDELAQLLAPHSVGGKLTFPVRTRLLWGRPRRSAKP